MPEIKGGVSLEQRRFRHGFELFLDMLLKSHQGNFARTLHLSKIMHFITLIKQLVITSPPPTKKVRFIIPIYLIVTPLCIQSQMLQIDHKKMKRPNTKDAQQSKKQKQAAPPRVKDISSYRPELYALPAGYSAAPSQQEIFASNGRCEKLLISNSYGTVEWNGTIDLSHLKAPLKSTVLIGDKFIQVYLADNGKPERGKELNRSCLATFNASTIVPTEDLIVMCRANNTELMSSNPSEMRFSVLIPHFTRYTFADAPKKKEKEVKEESRFSDLVVCRTVRNRILQEGPNTREPLTSMRRQYEASEDKVEYQEEQTGMSDIFDGLKDFVLNFQEKIKEKEVLLPKIRVEEDKSVLSTYNTNRAQFGYPPYRFQKMNVPALHNYMFSASGALVQLKNYPNHKKISFLEGEEQAKAVDSCWDFSLLLDDALTSESKARIICNPAVSPTFRRRLALHSIMFQRQVSFGFQRKSNYSPCSSNSQKMDENKRVGMIKDWLAWVIRETYSQRVVDYLPFKNKLMTALALRQPSLAQDHLMVNNCWISALALPCLEDQLYRDSISKQDIQSCEPQIKMILSSSIQRLACPQWIINLGLCSWYFNQMNFVDYLGVIVNSDQFRSKIKPSFSIQFKLFQLFAVTNGVALKNPLYFDRKPAIEDLCFQWLLSNRLHSMEIEQKVWKGSNSLSNGSFLFQVNNYRIVQKIIKELGKNRRTEALKVVNLTQQLSEQQFGILKNLVKTDQGDIVTRVERMLAEGNLFEALNVCIESRDIQTMNRTLRDLVVHPAILFPNNQEISSSVRKLLEKYPEQFGDLILIIEFQDDQQMGLKELRRLIEISQGKTRFDYGITALIRGAISSKIERKVEQWMKKKSCFFDDLLNDKYMLQIVKAEIRDQQLVKRLVQKESRRQNRMR